MNMKRLRFRPKAIAFSALLLTILLTGSALALYAWLLADLPPVSALEARAVRPTASILDRNGRLLYEVIDPEAGKQITLALDDIPQMCQDATIATEDGHFYQHPGVDPVAIARAAVQNLRSGEIVSGASTLTQQLARMLLLEPEERLVPTYKRKLREAYLAWRLDSRYTKDELLALYLNQSYYGNFAFGIEAAAQIFFGKPAAQLSRGECALLAGLIQYPGGYNPLNQPDVAKARQQTVLRLLREDGYISTEEAAQIEAEPLRYRTNLFAINAPHFVMYVQDELARALGPETLRAGGLTVMTTLDLDLQRAAERAVTRRLDELNCRTPGHCDATTDPGRRIANAAAVVLDAQNGEILAMVGSPDYFDPAIQGNVNAALSLRQPGSAIKPLTYAAAMDPAWSQDLGIQPLTPADIIADLPTTFYGRNAAGEPEPYTPLNYDRTFHGPVSVRTALASSYNIPAVKVLERIGVEALRSLAAQAGITSFTGDYGLALTLGGGEVRLLELAAAFGILDDGKTLRPVTVRNLSGTYCEVVPDNCSVDIPQPSPNPVIDPATAYLITDILSDPVARMPAFGSAAALNLPFPAAVKTGTTTDWRDNWTVGYSPERIVGVWVGNSDNTPMAGVNGLTGAAPIWHDIMLAAHDEAADGFTRPAAVVERQICAPSGLLPTPDCPQLRNERFATGTEPTEPDNQFRRVDGQLWRTLPPAYGDWAASRQGMGSAWQVVIDPQIDAAGAAPRQGALPSDIQPDEGANAKGDERLVLAAPAHLAAYQLHPGRPPDTQRVRVSGYVADSTEWATVRLRVDDEILATVDDAAQIAAWWVLEPGNHQVWLEGEKTADGSTIRSPVASVTVAPVDELQ
jgi:penicillin-binding protein 1C